MKPFTSIRFSAVGRYMLVLAVLIAPQADGTSVAMGAFSSPTTPSAQGGGFAYVANQGGTVSAYRIDGTTGALTSVGAVPAGSGATSVAVDFTAKFAYVANFFDNNVSAYTIDPATGALTQITGSPFPAGMGAFSVAINPTGQFVYVANRLSNDVSAYVLDSTTGALAAIPGSPFAAGQGAHSVAIDPTGQFLCVANHFDSTISVFAIDTTSGALTAVPGSPFAAGSFPGAVTVDPTGRFVYVANCGSSFCLSSTPGTVSAYTLDATTGALTEIAGSPFSAGTSSVSVAADPTGQFVYVTNFASNDVSAYTIDATSGALTQIAGSAFAAGAGPHWLTTDPTGQFLYVANRGADNVSSYTIDGATGALSPTGTVMAGSMPSGITTTQGNRPPVISSGPTANPSTVVSGDTVSLSVTASDPDGDALSYSWTQISPAAPAGVFTNPNLATTSWRAPAVSAGTSFTLQVTVSDGRGGTVSGQVQVTTTPPSYANDIQPIFSGTTVDLPHCTNCHGGPFPSGGLNLGPGVSYGNLVNVLMNNFSCSTLKRVLPSDPDNSGLWLKVAGTSCGARMPFNNPSFFDSRPDLLEKIRSWILSGAPNN